MSQYESKFMTVDERKLLCMAVPGVTKSLSLITVAVEEAIERMTSSLPEAACTHYIQ